MYTVLVVNSFTRSYKKIKNKSIHIELENIINILEKDPTNISKKHNIKKLVNVDDGIWRIRVGVYRIRYDIDKKNVILKTIMHRNDVYK